MPLTISAAATSLLARPVVAPRCIVEVFSHYLDADQRVSVDISDDVVKFSRLTGTSTLKKIDWELPSLTVSCRNCDELGNPTGRFNRGAPGSVWTTLGDEPENCSVRFQYVLDLPGGGVEVLQTYYGTIREAVHRESEDMALVDIVTAHMADAALDASITKQSGDRMVILNGVY